MTLIDRSADDYTMEAPQVPERVWSGSAIVSNNVLRQQLYQLRVTIERIGLLD